jgi:hypothetical protein
MIEIDKRKSIDLLVDHFWKQGYMSISRKYGRYLPEPDRIGNFEVDVVARYKKNYAIGITVSKEDLRDASFLERVSYLATRQTKFSNQKVILFIGIPQELFKKTNILLDNIDPETKKNIHICRIIDKDLPSLKRPLKKALFVN